jgi:hypothetical protein
MRINDDHSRDERFHGLAGERLDAVIEGASRAANARCGPVVLTFNGIAVLVSPRDFLIEIADRWGRAFAAQARRP